MGGQSKARGTREQRISQALDRKKLEANKDIEKEIMWCHYQKFAMDNDKYIPYVVEEEIARDEKDLLCSECKEGEWHDVFEKKKYQYSDKFNVINLFEVENYTINVSLS